MPQKKLGFEQEIKARRHPTSLPTSHPQPKAAPKRRTGTLRAPDDCLENSTWSFQQLPAKCKYLGHALEQLVRAGFQSSCNTLMYILLFLWVLFLVLCGHQFKLWKQICGLSNRVMTKTLLPYSQCLLLMTIVSFQWFIYLPPWVLMAAVSTLSPVLSLGILFYEP